MTLSDSIGQYRIEECLSNGRRADVYRAVDVIRKRTVALKLLHVGAPGDEATLRRRLQQVQRAAELVHPHIAWVWETGESDGHFYVAERYVNGPSLARLLAEKGPFTWDAARLAIGQIGQALDFAHGRGWVHGWIHAGQILVSTELGAVVTGFGWPQPPIPEAQATAGGTGISGAGQELPGNGAYLAPEIWLGQPARPAADQYALACVWAELLSGQPLFGGKSWEEVRDLHFMPAALRRAWPEGTPWQFETALTRALASEPGDRYPDLAALLAAPEALAAHNEQSPESLARSRAELRARREEEEQARRQAEDAARLAALAQARREVEERIRRAQEIQAQEAQAPAEIDTPVEEAPAPRKTPAVRRRPEHTPAGGGRRRWGWIGLAAIVLALAVYGLARSGGMGGFWPATPSASATLESASPTTGSSAIITTIPPDATATGTLTPSFTPTIASTATATRTQAPSFTPTITPTDTPSPSATRTPTRTPTPRNQDNNRRE